MEISRANLLKEEFFKRSPLFSFLPAIELVSLKKNFSGQYCKKDEYIFFEGEPCHALYILLEGKVKIVKQTSGGKEIILEIISPGEFFGAVALISNSPFPASSITLTPACILKLPKKLFLSLRARFPETAAIFTETLGRRLIAAHNFKKTISHDTVEVRLAASILKMNSDLKPHEREIQITRKELAELVGTTVETTIRTLSRFMKMGAIESTRGKITVKSPDSLKKVKAKGD